MNESLQFRPPRASHWLTRTLLLRGLGLVYLVAFTVIVTQHQALLGSRGLLPVVEHLPALERAGHSAAKIPSLFWWSSSDGFMLACGWLGVCASVLLVAGISHGALLVMLWALYLSFVNVGQIWYGYGWEILLLESGFLAIFLAPWRSFRPMSLRSPPPALVIWLYRWLVFRLMLGAGLIKMRGDECWRDLTCMQFHYETQPNPHPLSWLWHKLPNSVHAAGTLFNHFVELLVPFAVFAPRPYRTIAGCLLVAFQLMLIASGNLSFLNWLTLVLCLSCFDDQALLRLFRGERRERLAAWLADRSRSAQAYKHRRWLLGGLAALVGGLSLNPVMNMLSPRQHMNTSFERFNLVNTYGAFGSVDRERYELVIQGRAAGDPTWHDYALPCQPGPTDRRPCLITPFHYRLDWQIWYPFNSRGRPAWLYHLLYKLLKGDALARGLFPQAPFADQPPRWVRVEIYRYRFTDWGEAGWWKRERVDSYIGPLSLDDPQFREALDRRGWLEP